MAERWRDVVGYEGLYQVSDLGRVRSLDRIVRNSRGGTWKQKGCILQSFPGNQRGYLSVNLYRNGIQRKIYVHQLVALIFIGPIPADHVIRHGPNGILDNAISNLCYGTKSDDGLDKRRDGTHGGRPVERSDGEGFINMAVAAEETGCQYENIWQVCKGRRKTAGGFGWKFI